MNRLFHALTVTALVLAASSVPAAAAAEEEEGAAERSVPYARFYEPYAGTRSARHAEVALAVKAMRDDTDLGPVTMVIHAPDGAVPVPVAADGTFDLPLNADWAAHDARIEFNHPQDTIHILVSFRMKALKQAYSMAEIHGALEDVDDLIADQAGMLSVFAPSARAVLVACGPGCTASTADGAVLASANEHGVVRLEPSRALVRANPTVTLSGPVTAARITSKRE